MVSSTPNISSLIELLVGSRSETFEFERALAVIRFSTWALWPDDRAVQAQADLTAAAHLVKLISKRKTKVCANPEDAIEGIARNCFQPQRVATVLGSLVFNDQFLEPMELETEQLALVGKIVEFFIACPKEGKPSLNKATAFLDAGGFGVSHQWSESSLRKFWVKSAVAAPFILAQEKTEIELIGTAPDDPSHIAFAIKLSRERDALRDFFGQAKTYQDALVPRLDDRSRARFQFIRFPPDLKGVNDIEPLDAEEMEILSKYRAPKRI